MDIQDLKEKKDVTPNTPLADLDLKVNEEPREIKEKLETQEKTPFPEKLDLKDHLEAQDLKDPPDLPDHKEMKATLVVQEAMR